MKGRQVIISGHWVYDIVKVASLLESKGWHILPTFVIGNVKEEQKEWMVSLTAQQFDQKMGNQDFLLAAVNNWKAYGWTKYVDVDRDNVIVVPTMLRVAYENLLREKGCENITTIFLEVDRNDADEIMEQQGVTISHRDKIEREYATISFRWEYDYIFSESPEKVTKFINNIN